MVWFYRYFYKEYKKRHEENGVFGFSQLSGLLLWKEHGAGEMLDLDPVQYLLLIYSVTQPFPATSIFCKTEIMGSYYVINVPEDIVTRSGQKEKGKIIH